MQSNSILILLAILAFSLSVEIEVNWFISEGKISRNQAMVALAKFVSHVFTGSIEY